MGRGVGIQEQHAVGFRQVHAVVHDAAGVVFLRRDLDEMGGSGRVNEFLRAIAAAAVDHDEFKGRVSLRGERGQGLVQRPGLVVGAHDNADEGIAHEIV